MRFILLVLLPLLCFSQKKENDSIQLYYPTNSYQLSTIQKKHIQETLNYKTHTVLKIKGYADYIGTSSYNKKLSERRCNATSSFLKTLHFKSIKTIAYGELSSTQKTSNGNPKHRKVCILFSKNNSLQKNLSYSYLSEIKNYKYGEQIRLKNIHFKLATDTLIQNSKAELNQLATILKEKPSIHIQIEGHVCCGMEKEVDTQKTTYENQWLSDIRATKIYNYLIVQGIEAKRLSKIGYGFLKPLKYPEETEADRQKNRRIEIRIVNPNYISKIAELKKGDRIVLKNINFEYGQYRLTSESFEEIENIYQVLKNNPKIILAIEGHVCCGKNEEALGKIKSHYNTRLSNNRAKAVREELVRKGIDENRIFAKGFGFSRPLYFPETSDADKQENRRIEALILAR